VNELENVWAWECEECHRWQHPERTPYAVIVREADSVIHTVYGTEALYVNRKMVICATCWNSMRVTDPVSMVPPPNPVRPSR
jgi:hypothetical protein